MNKDNEKLLYRIKETALRSVFWSRKAVYYHTSGVYNYAPMIDDKLFKRLFSDDAIIGVKELEDKLKRRLKVEELTVCPLSVNYLLFGEPDITGSEEEENKLLAFESLIKESIRKNERRTIFYEINRLNKLLEEY